MWFFLSGWKTHSTTGKTSATTTLHCYLYRNSSSYPFPPPLDTKQIFFLSLHTPIVIFLRLLPKKQPDWTLSQTHKSGFTGGGEDFPPFFISWTFQQTARQSLWWWKLQIKELLTLQLFVCLGGLSRILRNIWLTSTLINPWVFSSFFFKYHY